MILDGEVEGSTICLWLEGVRVGFFDAWWCVDFMGACMILQDLALARGQLRYRVFHLRQIQHS